MTCLLKNARLLDAEHNHAVLDILIDGETIAAVGADLGTADQKIDLSGYTVLQWMIGHSKRMPCGLGHRMA